MFHIAAFYRFTPFEHPAALKPPLQEVCNNAGVTGTMHIAAEGLNGTLAGDRAGLARVLDHLHSLPGCARLGWTESTAAAQPFGRLKIRIKREVVTMGQPGVDPSSAVGRYVLPAEWNALIAAPDVAVIDVRNDYEVAIGTFSGALDPETRSFREFPGWWVANRAMLDGKRIAMFCTGGIRCEKATSWLVAQGVEEVHHLKGGVLKYLEEVPEDESLWQGSCFVFDRRVSVGPGLAEGAHTLCHGCRRPLAPSDLERPQYETGVSCHRCFDERDAEDRARFRARQRQLFGSRLDPKPARIAISGHSDRKGARPCPPRRL